MASFSKVREEVFDKQQRRERYSSYILGLNAYDRHKQFMNDYARHYGTSQKTSEPRLPIKTDEDTLRETYRFIRSEEDDSESSWEQRLAKRYYDKLFKEYCLADMSRYKESKIGMRWRTEKEVIAGKGQFVCGNKDCSEKNELCSFEVNFVYKEAGESKQALVKLRLCPKCAHKLNYRKEREQKRQIKQELKKSKKRRSKEESGDVKKGTSDDEGDEQQVGAAVASPEGAGHDKYDRYFKDMFM